MGTDLTQMQPDFLALAIHFVSCSLLSQPLGGLQLASQRSQILSDKPFPLKSSFISKVYEKTKSDSCCF